jgi:hypothetical protein
MKDIFWNIRGLGTKGRKQCVIDVIRNHNLDFIWMQETKTKTFSGNYLNSFAGTKQLCWNWLPSIGSDGGILMGFDEDVFDVKQWTIREFSLSCDVIHKKDKN